ncbi:conserved protein, unknown function [Hepatocystis sp. ex Piliocolobus tephrosceles]|nr:conserved protein, unknown function [Hepatocystis sp. ex Piliocolobus tephrosceles]
MSYRLTSHTDSTVYSNDSVTFLSDETVDTELNNGNRKKHKWKDQSSSLISKNINVNKNNRTKPFSKNLSVIDDFKLILLGCIGSRTYKMYCLV